MKLLLLAGTPESVQVGQALARFSQVVTIASLARASRAPQSLNLPIRIGGWGGEAAFTDWLLHERIEAVLDVTHPFAARISERTARVCAAHDIPYVQFLRPPWVPHATDNWTFLNSGAEAALHVPEGARVLLATGRHGLEDFYSLEGRTIFLRVRDRGQDAFPFSHGRFVHHPAPMSFDALISMLHALGIDWVIARNSGGGAGMPVIEAARQLGIPVGMIRRPPQPQAARIRTVTEALAWVRRRL